MKTDKTIIKSYCGTCQNETNHFILNSKRIRLKDPEYHFETFHYMLECCGCETISFRIEGHDYESAYPDQYDNWTHDISVNIYPSPLKNHRPISERHLLPPEIKTVYSEAIEALKANCKLLAGVGFRAVIEAICIDKNIIGRNLEVKITKLLTNKFITDKEAERLHAVRFLGNDSVHEMAVPKEKALYVVLEIVEHLLNNLYIIDHHAKPVLDMYITDFDDFQEFLLKKLKLFNASDEFPLAKFLEKDVRRLNGQIATLESSLITKIQSGEFQRLAIGAVKPFGTNSTESHQHFVKV
jgi:hypothetical protein